MGDLAAGVLHIAGLAAGIDLEADTGLEVVDHSLAEAAGRRTAAGRTAGVVVRRRERRQEGHHTAGEDLHAHQLDDYSSRPGCRS